MGRVAKKINRQLYVLIATGMIATSLLGVSYAKWEDELVVSANITTGKLDVEQIPTLEIMSLDTMEITIYNSGSVPVSINLKDDVELIIQEWDDDKWEVEDDYEGITLSLREPASLDGSDRVIILPEETVIFGVSVSEEKRMEIYSYRQQALRDDDDDDNDDDILKLIGKMTFSQAGIDNPVWMEVLDIEVIVNEDDYDDYFIDMGPVVLPAPGDMTKPAPVPPEVEGPGAVPDIPTPLPMPLPEEDIPNPMPLPGDMTKPGTVPDGGVGPNTETPIQPETPVAPILPVAPETPVAPILPVEPEAPEVPEVPSPEETISELV